MPLTQYPFFILSKSSVVKNEAICSTETTLPNKEQGSYLVCHFIYIVKQ